MKQIKQIKSYSLLKEIGEGANAKVYLGYCEKRKKLVAIKAISINKVKEKKQFECLKRELSLLHKLKHPNVMTINGNEKTPNNIYIVSEFCNGGSLHDLLTFFIQEKKGPIPEYLVQNIVRQITLGLNFMHKKKAIHRDIKLENILINFRDVPNTIENISIVSNINYAKMDFNEMDIKIADFGYSRDFADGDVASSICGTPLTMAPDIFKRIMSVDQASYNAKVDLWSLGAITYELLIGYPPFNAVQMNKLFQKVLIGDYVVPKKLKISLEALIFINGLLQKDPAKRMDWGQIISSDFLHRDYSELTTITVEEKEELLKGKDIEMNTNMLTEDIWCFLRPKEQILISNEKKQKTLVDLSFVTQASRVVNR